MCNPTKRRSHSFKSWEPLRLKTVSALNRGLLQKLLNFRSWLHTQTLFEKSILIWKRIEMALKYIIGYYLILTDFFYARNLHCDDLALRTRSWNRARFECAWNFNILTTAHVLASHTWICAMNFEFRHVGSIWSRSEFPNWLRLKCGRIELTFDVDYTWKRFGFLFVNYIRS